jgi:1,2-phenylacetyl-CoA epoxidase catalytic subunit
MRLLAATLTAAALLVQPAAAQFNTGKKESQVEKDYQQLQKDRAEIDRQYRETVKRNLRNEGNTANDPWANFRNAPPPGGTR